MSHKRPQTVSELFPRRWLSADDLNGRTYTVTIQRAYLDEVYSKRENKHEFRIVLDFGRTKELCLNKTQSFAVADIAKSEIWGEWAELTIQLKPSLARNRKPTIIVLPPPPAPPPEMAAGTTHDNTPPPEIDGDNTARDTENGGTLDEFMDA